MNKRKVPGRRSGGDEAARAASKSKCLSARSTATTQPSESHPRVSINLSNADYLRLLLITSRLWLSFDEVCLGIEGVQGMYKVI